LKLLPEIKYPFGFNSTTASSSCLEHQTLRDDCSLPIPLRSQHGQGDAFTGQPFGRATTVDHANFKNNSAEFGYKANSLEGGDGARVSLR